MIKSNLLSLIEKMYILVAALNEEVSDLMKMEKDHILISGLGKLKTLMSVSDFFHTRTEPISCVINLGTAGSNKIPTGQLVEVVRSYQRDTTFFSEMIPLRPATNLPQVSCGSGDRVEECQQKDPWDIVDMELFALAFFCHQKKIPLVSIKYVTDRNDKSLYKEWKNQVPIASQELSHFWINKKQQILARFL